MPPSRLTSDPSLPLPPAAFRALVRAVDQPGSAYVPSVEGVEPPVVVRWLYRRWLEGCDTFHPLVHLDGPIPEDVMAEVYRAAAGGWLLRTGITEPPQPPAGVRLVLPQAGEALRLPPHLVSRLMSLDEMHHVATDPGLDRVRRSLLSHARTGAAVLLSGPPGAGRHTLVRLTWARLAGDTQLVDAALGPVAPEAWAVFAAPALLDHEARQTLRRRLRPDPPPPPRPAAGPPTQRPDHPAFNRIVGESPALCRLLQDTARVARSPASVLILGEPGVGKELLAHALHDASHRAGAFEAVDLSAIPRDLVESELFGHVRGAFTGATGDRPGAFRRAEGGTLFLDELGNLDPTLQVKLLRVLQERVVRPVGAERAAPVDVRVVAATNADLDAMVARGAFRLDLLHRLNAITLRIPPLRERPEDILRLALRFLAEARGEREAPPFTPEAEQLLTAWPWPGNVRELWGVMMRAGAFTAPGDPLGAAHLEPITRGTARGPTFVIADTVDEPIAVRLAVPDLGDRGTESVHHAIYTLAAGRLVRADALPVLAAAAVKGGFPSLRADIDALLAAEPGPIDRAAITRSLPHLLPATAEALYVVTAGGGLERRYSEDVLIVGRARNLADLDGTDRRGAARLAAVRALGGTSFGFLPFPEEAGLSRAQVLVRRREGIEVHLLPDAAAPTWVYTRSGGRHRLAVGRPAHLGDAGAVEIQLDRAATRHLRLGLCLGAAARERGDALAPPATAEIRGETARAPDLDPPEGGRGSRVWTLDAAERRLLNEIVLAYGGGDFGAHLRGGLLTRREDPAHIRLAAYLLRTRPTQYCARVYDSDGNAALREELCARLRTREGAEAWVAGLPIQLRAVIHEAMARDPGLSTPPGAATDP